MTTGWVLAIIYFEKKQHAQTHTHTQWADSRMLKFSATEKGASTGRYQAIRVRKAVELILPAATLFGTQHPCLYSGALERFTVAAGQWDDGIPTVWWCAVRAGRGWRGNGVHRLLVISKDIFHVLLRIFSFGESVA